MTDSAEVQSNFLGGRFSPNAQGRFDLPEYAHGLAECLNAMPVEEGAVMPRSGTRELGPTFAGGIGQCKEFRLPGNVAAILELTPSGLRTWAQDNFVGYRLQAPTFSTPYNTTAQCQAVRIVQADTQAFFCANGVQTHVLTHTGFDAEGGPTWVFDSGGWPNADGPYINAFSGASQTNNSLGTISGGGRLINFTCTDGAYSFVATDLNRNIRIWSQPPAWQTNTEYGIGDVVTYNGTFWTAILGGAEADGIFPGQNSQPAAASGMVPSQAWSINPYLGIWAWGFINTVISSSEVAVTILSPMTLPYSTNGNVIDTWMLGLFTNMIWPTCGCYQQGRVWFGGADTNRFDACTSDGIGQNGQLADGTPAPPLFSPTDQYGNVLDSSGIAAQMNVSPLTNILWMEPYQAGIICGSESDELFINSSVLGDPLTPTTVQVNPVSRYRSQNSEPVRLGVAIAFIQAWGRRLVEYVIDVFSQKFIGRHLNIYAKDLSSAGIIKIVYQEELAPVIWCVMNDGTLAGCTYRRVSTFGQEGPAFMGWHQHALGSGRTVQWACLGSDYRGRQDVLVLMTQDALGNGHMEMMLPLMDVNDELNTAWYLDSAVASSTLTGDDNGTDTLTITGLPYSASAGTDVGVFLAGLYCGEYQVQPGGIVNIPYGSDPDGYLTAAYLIRQNGTYPTYLASSVTAGGKTLSLPLVVGFLMTSTVTMLRPQSQNATRTPSGPGLAMTRRVHQYGLQLANTITGLEISVDGGPTTIARLVGTDQQTQLDHVTMFDGVFWDTVDGDNNFDGQMSISQTLPYPWTLAAVSRFLRTSER